MLNIQLVLYWTLMIIAAVISTWGTFVSLPYEHLGQWEAIKMALPFAWVDWVFLTVAIYTGTKYSLATPLQMKFGITMIKFFLIMLFTKYYLRSKITRSDVVGFVIVFIAYILNVTNTISHYFGIVHEKKDVMDSNGKPKEADKPKESTEEKPKDDNKPKESAH